jgi:signal transduction histidine kinase
VVRDQKEVRIRLAIVKHIIEAHKEKIYVESEFGVGSEFSLLAKQTGNKQKRLILMYRNSL